MRVGGNDFFKTVQGSIERAMAFMPDRHGDDVAGVAQQQGACGCILCLGGSQAVLEIFDDRLREGQIVKIATGSSTCFALVTIVNRSEHGHLAELELFGEGVHDEGSPGLCPEVRCRPNPGDFAYTITEQDYSLLWPGEFVAVGKCVFDQARDVHITEIKGVLGIVGAPETGKSSALALYLSRRLARCKQTHVLLFDVKGEHQAQAEQDLCLPYWLLGVEEWATLLHTYSSGKFDYGHLRRVLSKGFEGLHVSCGAVFEYGDLITEVAKENRSIGNVLEALARDENMAFLFPQKRDEQGGVFGFGPDRFARSNLTKFSKDLASVIAGITVRVVNQSSLAEGPMVLALDDVTSLQAAFLTEQLKACMGRDNLMVCLVVSEPHALDNDLLSQIDMLLAFGLRSDKSVDALLQARLVVAESLLDPLLVLKQREALWIGNHKPFTQRIMIDDAR